MTATAALLPDNALVAPVGDRAFLVALLGTGARAVFDLAFDRNPGAPVRVRASSWVRSGKEGPQRGAVALVGLAQSAGPERWLALGRTNGRRAVVRTGLRAFAAALIADAGRVGYTGLADGLVEQLLAGESGEAEVEAAFLLADAAADDAGCIEVVGRTIGGPCFVQGWARDLPPCRMQVVVQEERPAVADLFAANFDRDDLGEGAVGFAALLKSREGVSASVRALLYRGVDGWRRIHRYERASVIEPHAVPGHIRSILGRVRAPADVLAPMAAATHRFEGQETVSRLREPVRIGIDHAFLVEGSGVLASGWLLDPDRRVEAVRLNGPGGSVQISDDWTRLSRPDVTTAFIGEPQFRGLDQTRHGHGFIAFAPRVTEGAAAAGMHVELRLRDGVAAFFPIAPTPMAARQSLLKIIASIDPRAGFTLRAAERQFAPVLQSAMQTGRLHVDTTDLGFDDDAPLALVIGADELLGEVKTLLALLALDPQARECPIVLAGPAESFMQAGGDIRRLAAFYGLKLRLAAADGVEDTLDALEAGIGACRAPDLLLLSAHLLPESPGWIGGLESAYRQRRGAIVSPTILFEDGSVRWAGMEFEDGRNGRELRARLGFRPVDETVESAIASLDCCLLPRAAFAATSGFARGYLGTLEKATEMGLRLRLGGAPSYWVPSVRMVGAEAVAATLPNAWQLSRRIDRFAFDRRLSLAVANLRGAAQ